MFNRLGVELQPIHMRKYLLILTLCFFIPASSFAISVVGGQGYGSFRLSGAGSTSMGSIMTVGVRFNKYIELKYLSLDTSIRMPVMPFRLYDLKYASATDSNGDTHYTYYDSDVMGLNLTLPVTNRIGWSVLYGFGRAITSRLTQVVGVTDPTATIHKGAVHVFSSDVHADFQIGKTLVLTPAIGTMVHFLDKDAAYKNAMSWYTTVSVCYAFNSDSKDE